MTPENFCYWLQGFLEISKTDQITKEQVEEIKNHLALIFTKVTPNLEPKQYGVTWNPPIYQTVTAPACNTNSQLPNFDIRYLSHVASC